MLTFAQGAGEKIFPKNFVSLKVGTDDPWIGIVYERIWIRCIATEIQIGLIGSSAGVKLYFPGIKSKRVNLYFGAMPGWGFAGVVKTYFPIGINGTDKKMFGLAWMLVPGSGMMKVRKFFLELR